jgi:hypothetical protein
LSRQPKHTVGDTPEQGTIFIGLPFGTKHDQIDCVVIGMLDNRLVWPAMPDCIDNLDILGVRL